MPYRTIENRVEGVVLTFADITQQKAVQAELRAHEQFLHSIYTGIDLPIFVLDVNKDGTFSYRDINPANERMTGYSREMVIGKRNEELVPPLLPEQIQEAHSHYRRCVETGEAIEYEQRMDIAGDEAWWLARLDPVQDEQNQVYRIIGTARLITQRKQAEAAVRRRENLLVALGTWWANLAANMSDEAQVLNGMCRMLIEHGGYTVVWIGSTTSNGSATMRASTYVEAGVNRPDSPIYTWFATEAGPALARSALQAGRPIITWDVQHDPAADLWRVVPLHSGNPIIVAHPFSWAEDATRVIILYAVAPEVDERAATLLHAFAQRLAAGLIMLRSRAGSSQHTSLEEQS